MRTFIRMACFSLVALFFSLGILPQGAFPQAAEPGTGTLDARTIPDALRRPQRGELPRYPQDVVIGALGRGDASEDAYRFARNLLAALAAGNAAAPVFAGSPPTLIGNYIEEIGSLEGPRSFRLGGGRIEIDGNVSFLIRFLGREESITGELFIRQVENSDRWFLDDIVLEERRTLAEIRDNHRFIFAPHERFF